MLTSLLQKQVLFLGFTPWPRWNMIQAEESLQSSFPFASCGLHLLHWGWAARIETGGLQDRHRDVQHLGSITANWLTWFWEYPFAHASVCNESADQWTAMQSISYSLAACCSSNMKFVIAPVLLSYIHNLSRNSCSSTQTGDSSRR